MACANTCDDIVYWADGTWAKIEDVRSGEYQHMSDDYEVINENDITRLKALGIAKELGLQ